MNTNIQNKTYLYNIKNGLTIKVNVAYSYSKHEKKYQVTGSESNFITMGKLDNLTIKVIKAAIKKYVLDNNIKIEGEIHHSLYGVYVINVA